MAVVVRGNVTGAKAVSDLLLGLEKRVFRPAARGAVSDASIVVVTESKVQLLQKTKRRTGSLYKSIGRKVRAVKNGMGYYAVVGPRRDPSAKKFAQQQADFAAGLRRTAPRMRFKRTVNFQGRQITVDPAKYAHLVEFGRGPVAAGSKTMRVLKAILGGKKVYGKGRVSTGKRVLSDGVTVFGPRVRAVAPMPFMRPAWSATEPRCYNIMVNSIRKAAARIKPVK